MIDFTYTSNKSSAQAALNEWSFEALTDCSSRVVPDGCRDFIVKCSQHQQERWFISDLSASTYSVQSKAQERMAGIRLKPGSRVKITELSKWLLGRNPCELMGCDLLDEFCVRSAALSEALDCLNSGVPSVQYAANELGVSLRTLQRLIKAETNCSPQFWYSLGKIRKAGRSLGDFATLSDAAYNLGFADQAHLTREMNRWFGETPKKLRENKEIMSLLTEPGYG